MGHIISADSVQVYSGVQIGANKPTPAELDATPHHLINIVDATSTTPYNAADWRRDAIHVIEDLTGADTKNERDEIMKDSDGDLSFKHSLSYPQTKTRAKIIDEYLQTSKKGDCAEGHILPVVVGGTMVRASI